MDAGLRAGRASSRRTRRATASPVAGNACARSRPAPCWTRAKTSKRDDVPPAGVAPKREGVAYVGRVMDKRAQDEARGDL